LTDGPARPSRGPPEADAEHALLFTALRWLLGTAAATGDVPDPSAVDWDRFSELLRRHGLPGTLQPVLAARLGDGMPAAAATRLHDAALRQAASSLRLAAALRDADSALRAAGVRYAVLKGLPLADAAYGSIVRRRCQDLDILVPRADFRRALNALRPIGFVPDRDLDGGLLDACLRFAADVPLNRSDGVSIELHHRVEAGTLAAGTRWGEFLLDAAEPWRLAGTDVPAVTGPAALPYLAVHGTLHAWFRLFWLVDVAILTARGSPDDLHRAWDVATRLDARVPLALAWRLSADWLGTEVPPFATDLARSAAVTRLAGVVASRVMEPEPGAPDHTVNRRLRGLRWSLMLAGTPARQLGILGRYLVAVQPDDIRAVTLPRPLHLLYPAVRPARLAAHLVRGLWEVARDAVRRTR
jgi:hypothetical protein